MFSIICFIGCMDICTQMFLKYCYAIMQMAVTWTSGYNIIDAVPFVEWGFKGESQTQSPAGTLTFHRNAMCGMIYVLFLLSYYGDFNHQCNPLFLRKAFFSSPCLIFCCQMWRQVENPAMLCVSMFFFFYFIIIYFLCLNCAPISSLNNCKAITNALLSNWHFGDLVNQFIMPWHYIQQKKERNSI